MVIAKQDEAWKNSKEMSPDSCSSPSISEHIWDRAGEGGDDIAQVVESLGSFGGLGLS